MPPLWVGFWAPSSLDKGLFRQIFHKHGWVTGYPEIDKKESKIGSFPPKLVIKVGMTASFSTWKRVPYPGGT